MILMAIWWLFCELQIAPRLVKYPWDRMEFIGINESSINEHCVWMITTMIWNKHYTKFKTCFVCLILLVFQYQSRSFEVAWELSSHCQSVVPSDGWAIHWLKQKIWSQWPRVTIKLHRRDSCICSKCVHCHCAFQTHTWTTSKINAKRRRNRT